jgi:hypothetical protein
VLVGAEGLFVLVGEREALSFVESNNEDAWPRFSRGLSRDDFGRS